MHNSKNTDGVWETDGGDWTLASFIVRCMCQSDVLSSAELYWILNKLGVAKRFSEYWDRPQFWKNAGLGQMASESLRRNLAEGRDKKCRPRAGCTCCPYHEWLSQAGDVEWSAGNTVAARELYERCIGEHGTQDYVVSAGIGGLTRLNFVEGDYSECIKYFARGCPPDSFYSENHKTTERIPDDYGLLASQYPGTSPYFISTAQYMCRAIVYAAIQSNCLNESLRQNICNYFGLDHTSLKDLETALSGNTKELPRLLKRIAPRKVKAEGRVDDLLDNGGTDRARRLCNLIPSCDDLVKQATIELDRFLENGSSEHLENLILVGSQLVVPRAQEIILEETLDCRRERILTMPARRLHLLRRFNPICLYPKYDFVGEFIEVINQVREDIQPTDVVSGILNTQWYKTPYTIDDTSRTGSAEGFGKTEVSRHREWVELLLQSHPTILCRDHYVNREIALATLHEAYLYVRERYLSMQSEERWFSEAQLGDALSSLFGKDTVERHARPIWLSPQHLDYYLPRYALAVEYMGAQHYEPIEYFGGAKMLGDTKARDKRKLSLCRRMKIHLEYVTHEEDIGKRAKEIYDQYGQ